MWEVGRALRFAVGVLAAAATALAIGSNVAYAYASGSIGYDISYPQCGSYAASAVAARSVAAPARFVAGAGSVLRGTSPLLQSSVQPRSAAPPIGSATFHPRNSTLAFAIVGVDGGRPFNSLNACLASEYASAPSPGLYINTGYDPSYVTNHTTASCTTQSQAVTGTTAQKQAWAVGCSEAQDDYGYAQSKGITGPVEWWLDVETANSWCGPAPSNCTDLSLNQYTIQGIIDEFTHIGAVPVGIYSNKSQWSAIVGSLAVTGAAADWVASGTSTARQAATYCNSGSSFTGAPVTIVQFLSRSLDLDYAC
jgi:hypothetical protein